MRRERVVAQTNGPTVTPSAEDYIAFAYQNKGTATLVQRAESVVVRTDELAIVVAQGGPFPANGRIGVVS